MVIINKTRIAVAGLHHGMNHVKGLDKCSEGDVVAVSDLKDKYKDIANKYGANYYRDYKSMISNEELDGIILALPNQLHAEAVEYCAINNLHILVEKPIADNLINAEKILEIDMKYDKKILVGQHRRFSNYIRKMKEVVQSGEIGEFVGANVMWNALKPDDYFNKEWRINEGGGPLNINLIHDIDDLRFIIGDIKSVSAEASNKNRDFEVEDSAAIVIKFNQGGLATILISDCTPSPFYYGAACQEDDMHSPSLQDCYYLFGTLGSVTMPGLKKYYYKEDNRRGWSYPLVGSRLTVEKNDPIFEEVKHFCQIINENKEPIITVRDGMKSLRAVLAVKKSIETGNRVNLSSFKKI